MTSTIFTQTDKNVLTQVSLLAFLKALFPCGSVTGAPKIRTMEIIRELEPLSRGVYTGAIGYFSPSGDAIFNVPIRTLRLRDGQGEMGIGSGIVQDSEPHHEWKECLLKAHFLTRSQPPFSLFETLLLEKNGGYWLLAYHLERLRQSAHYFSFYYDEKLLFRKIEKVEQENRDTFLRLRIILQKDGRITTESVPCDPPQNRCLPEKPVLGKERLPRISVSAKRVDSSSSFFFHKTSQRQLFQEEFTRAQKEGLFDIIFQNERDEITEGCITNLIIYKDEQYYTPNVASALLAGTMRRRLLAETEPAIIEQPLSLADLKQAQAIFCCNSVRGVVQVRLTEESV